MGAEKGSGIFHIFDWKRKSRKKLFGNSPEGAKVGKRNEESLPSVRFNLGDGEEVVGVASIKGGNSCSCASSVTDDDAAGTTAPSVVARLMGLDSMPSSSIVEPYCTPMRQRQALRESYVPNSSLDPCTKERYSPMQHRADEQVRRPFELRQQKMPSSPIERFQTEGLPPRSARSIAYQRLLSPVKNPSFSSTRNATQIMEAAAKIIEPRTQVSSRDKVCLFGPSRVPMVVFDPKERGMGSHRVSVLSQACGMPVESRDVRFVRGQQLNQSLSSEEDIVIFRPSIDSYEISPVCTRRKGKSVSLAVQAKANVQRRNGMSCSSQSMDLQKEHDELGANPHFRSQPNPQRSRQQRKPSPSNSSYTIRQNNQKQNFLPTRSKQISSKSASNHQGRKTLSTESRKPNNLSKVTSIASKKDGVQNTIDRDHEREGSSLINKDFPQKKRLIERSLNGEKVSFINDKLDDRLERQVRPNVVVDEHKLWNEDIKDTTDVVSFTFTSPLLKPSNESQFSLKFLENCNSTAGCSLDLSCDNSASTKVDISLSEFDCPNGDPLSRLLEQKLKELTSKIATSIDFSSTESFTPSTCSKGKQPLISHYNTQQDKSLFSKFEENIYELEDSQSSAKGQISWDKSQYAVVQGECSSSSDARKELYNAELSPLSTLEPIFSHDNSWSSETSSSNDGSKNSPSVQSSDFTTSCTNKTLFMDVSTPQSDQAPYPSELSYIKGIMSNIKTNDLFVNHSGTSWEPFLANKSEKQDCKLKEASFIKSDHKLLFDCVCECLDNNRAFYFQAGFEEWNLGNLLLDERLDHEVNGQINQWKGMGDATVDELVDKDMSIQLGTWTDFRIEKSETAVDIQDEIISSLIDGLLGDICAGAWLPVLSLP